MASKSVGKQVIDFLSKCTDPFHTVAHVEATLAASRFVSLIENEEWTDLKRGGHYMVKRNSSSICMFSVGEKYKPGNGIKMISAHTDSPCLKLKPASKKSNEGFQQVGVQLYGGGIWHTWFDRDLSMSGRVILKAEGHILEEKLVKFEKPLLNVPNICIHLDREYHKKFSPNLEKHVVPIIAAVEKHELIQGSKDSEHSSFVNQTSPVVVELLKKELSLEDVNSIVDFELALYDHQKPCLGGANDEFIFSARLDNLLSCYISTYALIDSSGSLKDEDKIRMAFLYDNEEVGSLSYQGADSRFTESIIRRVTEVLNLQQSERPSNELFERTLASSFHISMDVAHYVHPNYPEKHEDNMKPKLGGGPVQKINCNQRYASSSRSLAVLKSVAESEQNGTNKVPLQTLAVRNDSPCGTTVGPILAAKLGIETVDMGVGCLSMHSIRETGYVDDVNHGLNLITKYFNNALPVFK